MNNLHKHPVKLSSACAAGLYIGIMSGTSLDGVDAALCRFAPAFELIETHSVCFSAELKATLLALCTPSRAPSAGYSELDAFGKASLDYAKLVANAVHELLVKAGLQATDIIAIGCHGQTVRHRPELGFSLQLVDASYLAEHTRIATVTDFRRRDMAVGGQGAPLVPAFHAHAFMHEHNHRVLLNLGGIANITVLPAGEPDKVTGYDTGPANLLIDAWCTKHTGKPYDNSGAWARLGTCHDSLLNKLLSHPFFAQPAPKSTGREDFNLSWLESQLAGFANLTPVDVQATLTELTARSAAQAIVHTCSRLGIASGDVYVCGGGAYNTYLLERLAQHLPAWKIASSQALGLNPAWVESSAFAWLARQHQLGLTGNLPSVTGATKKVVLGRVAYWQFE